MYSHSPLASFFCSNPFILSLATTALHLVYYLLIKHATIIIYSIFFISILPFYSSSDYSQSLLLYSSAEIIFHLIFIHRRNALIQSHSSIIPPPKPSPELRRIILNGILTSFQSTLSLRQCLAGWFYPIDSNSLTQHSLVTLESIQSENLAELLAGLFHSSHLSELTQHDLNQIHQDVHLIEEKIQYQFQLGKNHAIRPMNHTLEPIQVEHRPLIFYLIIESFRFFIYFIFYLVGFRQFEIKLHHHLSFKYWFHPGFASTRMHRKSHSPPVPIILISGIIGLISIPHYAIYLLLTSNRPIFLVGNSSVSLTLMKPDFELIQVKNKNPNKKSKTYFRRKILTLKEQSTCILKMMKIHGFKVQVDQNSKSENSDPSGGAFLIGHSLGTTLVGHFLRNFPDSVSGTLSIDPISVLPYIPDLVRRFVYAEPKTIGEILVRIISREIGVATVIQRHFNWFEFVILTHLNKEKADHNRPPIELAKKMKLSTKNQNQIIKRRNINHHFILSDQDSLVNYEQVSNYLKNSQSFNLSKSNSNNDISFTTLIDTPHGGFLLYHLHKVVELTLKLLHKSEQKTEEESKSTNQQEDVPIVNHPQQHNHLISNLENSLSNSPQLLHPTKFNPFLNHQHHGHCHNHICQPNDNLKLVLFNDLIL